MQTDWFSSQQSEMNCRKNISEKGIIFAAKIKKGVRNMRSTFNILFYVNKSLPSLLIRKQTSIFVWHSIEKCVLGYTLLRNQFAALQAESSAD